MHLTLFWQLRHIALQICFFAKKLVFRMLGKIESIRLSLPLSKVVWWMLITEVVLGALYVFCAIKADSWILSLCKHTAFNRDVVRDVVLGGMGIAGVILGLYCANLSTIFSAKYTNAPRSLSMAYQRDFVSNICIRKSIRYIVTCVLLLMICLMEAEVYYVTASIFLFRTLTLVLTFSTAGNRSYELADTFRIADPLRSQIKRMMIMATKRGVISRDESFQNHFMRHCDASLDTIMDIARYNLGIPKEQNQAWCTFMVSNLALLLQYWKIKTTIYHASRWFKEKSTYQQWHTASDTEVRIHTHTGIPLSPTTEKDPWWFENRILEINKVGLEKLVKDRDTLQLRHYILQLSEISNLAYKANALEYWVEALHDISEIVKSYIVSETKENINKQEDLFAALAESLCPAYIDMLLGIFHDISALELDVLFDAVTQHKSFEECDFSVCRSLNSKECEKLYTQIGAEYAIEGRRITPDWYIQQIVGNQLYKEYGAILEVLQNVAIHVFSTGKFFLDQNLSYMASVIFVHYFNLRQKTQKIVTVLENLLPSLEEKRFEKSHTWDPTTTTHLRDELQQIEIELPVLLVKCCGTHAVKHWKKRDNVPDFLGFCYNQLSENLITSLEQSNYTTFEAVYSNFFSLALLYSEYIRTDVIKQNAPTVQMRNIALMSAPLIEFAAISGLAFIWGEYVCDTQWATLVKDTLKSFVSKSPDDSKRQLEGMVQLTSLVHDSLWGLSGRGILLTDWALRIGHCMQAHDNYVIEHKNVYSRTLKTDSKLLKAYIGQIHGDYLHLDYPEDVFLVICVNPYLPIDKQYKSKYGWEKWINEES